MYTNINHRCIKCKKAYCVHFKRNVSTFQRSKSLNWECALPFPSNRVIFSTNAMQSALPLFKRGRKQHFGKTSLQSFSSLCWGGSKGRVSLARGRKRKKTRVSADRWLLSFTTDNSKRSKITLRRQGRSTLDTGQRKYIVHWRIHWKRTPSHDEKRAATTCSNDWWAFKGVSLPPLFLPLSSSRGRKIYELVCTHMRTKCIIATT